MYSALCASRRAAAAIQAATVAAPLVLRVSCPVISCSTCSAGDAAPNALQLTELKHKLSHLARLGGLVRELHLKLEPAPQEQCWQQLPAAAAPTHLGQPDALQLDGNSGIRMALAMMTRLTRLDLDAACLTANTIHALLPSLPSSLLHLDLMARADGIGSALLHLTELTLLHIDTLYNGSRPSAPLLLRGIPHQSLLELHLETEFDHLNGGAMLTHLSALTALTLAHFPCAGSAHSSASPQVAPPAGLRELCLRGHLWSTTTALAQLTALTRVRAVGLAASVQLLESLPPSLLHAELALSADTAAASASELHPVPGLLAQLTALTCLSLWGAGLTPQLPAAHLRRLELGSGTPQLTAQLTALTALTAVRLWEDMVKPELLRDVPPPPLAALPPWLPRLELVCNVAALIRMSAPGPTQLTALTCLDLLPAPCMAPTASELSELLRALPALRELRGVDWPEPLHPCDAAGW
jgi:hypothetical protein